jgi:phosphoribosylglycinamide formyltransferase 1
MKPRLIIFASGSKTGGGSGFENLVNASRAGILDAEIVGVVSNHAEGGVRERADRLGVKFTHFAGPFTKEEYQSIVEGSDFVALSGWLKLVSGLDPKTTFNIHPGPLPQFGGPGMYGHHVHEAVIEAFHRGEVTHSAVTMHFVTEKYDEGPKFFEKKVEIYFEDDAETLGARVNAVEHVFQPLVTNALVKGYISWDGKNPDSLISSHLSFS